MAGRAGASRAQRGVASCGLHSGFLRLFKGLKVICCIVADDEYLCSWPVGVRDGAALWQTVQLFIKKLNAELLPDLAIPPLRASPRETETKTGLGVLTAGGAQQPPRGSTPHVHRWAKGHPCVRPHGERHSATERREAPTLATPWTDLENMMLYESFASKFKHGLITT